MARLPEVEPLGDARWARIEQSLMERLDELPSAASKSEVGRAFGEGGSGTLVDQGAGRVARRPTRTWPVAVAATFALSAAAAVVVRVMVPHVNASSSRDP